MTPHADSTLPEDPVVLATMIAALRGDLADERAALRIAELGLQAKTLEAERLRLQIARPRQEPFGRSSERLRANSISLSSGSPGVGPGEGDPLHVGAVDRADDGAARQQRLSAQQRRRAADATPGARPEEYLFAGSLEGGRRPAIIYTLITTAELSGRDPQAYLRVLLDRIADFPINRIGQLAPWNLRPDAA